MNQEGEEATVAQNPFRGKCTHDLFPYRPYRRGRNRCNVCGGRIPLSPAGKYFAGKVVDNILSESPFLKIMLAKDDPSSA